MCTYCKPGVRKEAKGSTLKQVESETPTRTKEKLLLHTAPRNEPVHLQFLKIIFEVQSQKIYDIITSASSVVELRGATPKT